MTWFLILVLIGGVAFLVWVAEKWWSGFLERGVGRAEARVQIKQSEVKLRHLSSDNEDEVRRANAQRDLARRREAEGKKRDQEIAALKERELVRDRENTDFRAEIANLVAALKERELVRDRENTDFRAEIANLVALHVSLRAEIANLVAAREAASKTSTSIHDAAMGEPPPVAREDENPRYFQRNFNESRLSSEARAALTQRFLAT